MSELVLTRQELQILLNHLGPRIKVDYPPTNLQLLDAGLDGDRSEITLYFQEDSVYSDAKTDTWHSEQPRYGDLVQCFLASGLITYPNLADLKERVQVYRNLRSKVVFCPDTNLFYNNFISATGLLRPEDLAFVDLCRGEIIASYNNKLTARDITTIKSEIKYQPGLYDELINRRNKVSRLAYNLAFQEYSRYQDRVYQVIKSEPGTRDSEQNDRLFVEAVKRYSDEGKTFPVVLTCDMLLIDLCEAYGVEYFHLELPTSIQPSLAEPWRLVNLLAVLSRVLGFIKIEAMVLFGEFRGKKTANEHKIRFLRGEAPLEFGRNLEICRELMKMGTKF